MAEEKSQKNWFAQHKILTAIIGVVGVFIILAAIGGGSDSNSSSSSTNDASKTSEAPSSPEPVKESGYQEIFKFSGSGAKQSEPFTITGNRFKIKYDCKGDLCSASLYEVGKTFPKDLIVNVTGNAKDETVLYGSGEYYINANTMGTYTFTVEDYK